MPWRLRKRVILIFLGAVALALAVIVLVLNRDASTELLASLGLIGGLAIVINSLPDNGNDKKEDSS
jgi:hypothetical protein